MLPTERPDYRRSREADLLAGLRSRDPLALAEAYHRTSPAAHGCARRLLGSVRAAEALMTAVYAELWETPPEIPRLEGWVRSRCFAIAAQHLRERGEPPSAPSLALLLADLPAPEQTAHDPAEQVLATLPEGVRRAVLLAHDQGLPTAAHDDPDAAAALDRGLMALAGPGEGVDDGAAEQCADVALMGDWILGLLEAQRAAEVTAEVAERPACHARSRALRRGRRRLEGLPPAPDMGQRILATVLGGSSGAPAPGPTAPATPVEDAPPVRPPPPTSSLGDAPGGPPIPVAPLPSALDEEAVSPPQPPAGEVALREPDGLDSDIEPNAPPLTAGPTGEEDVAVDRGASPDDQGLGDSRSEGGDTAADVALAHASGVEEEVDPDADLDAEAVTTSGETAAPRGGRKLARRLLNVLLIVIVLAAGGALGLVIGFLLVGGR